MSMRQRVECFRAPHIRMLSQGKPWAKFSWPSGQRPDSTRAESTNDEQMTGFTRSPQATRATRFGRSLSLPHIRRAIACSGQTLSLAWLTPIHRYYRLLQNNNQDDSCIHYDRYQLYYTRSDRVRFRLLAAYLES
jgi:hypothetical protein